MRLRGCRCQDVDVLVVQEWSKIPAFRERAGITDEIMLMIIDADSMLSKCGFPKLPRALL
jgi:hypothetical protein